MWALVYYIPGTPPISSVSAAGPWVPTVPVLPALTVAFVSGAPAIGWEWVPGASLSRVFVDKLRWFNSCLVWPLPSSRLPSWWSPQKPAYQVTRGGACDTEELRHHRGPGDDPCGLQRPETLPPVCPSPGLTLAPPERPSVRQPGPDHTLCKPRGWTVVILSTSGHLFPC